MCIDTAAWYHRECPGLALPRTLSASSTMCQHDAALKLISSHRFSENTDNAASRPQDSASSQCCPVPCENLGFFGVSMSILNALLPLAVRGNQNSFFRWTNEGVGGAALASCKHLGVPLFFYLKVFHFSFEVAIATDQLINSGVGDICEGCLQALASFCPTLLRAQCNVLLMTLMVIVATEPFLWLQQQHTIAQSSSSSRARTIGRQVLVGERKPLHSCH